MEASMRYRVNVTISTKGVKTWDCTAEYTAGDDALLYEHMDAVLERSDELVKRLETRYPMDVG